MRLLFTTMLSLLFAFAVHAQQGVQYTQFMFNKLGFNPAYAGSHEVACISGIHRSQWVGFEGAPTSQSLNFHTPLFANRVGMGLSLQHDKIGPTNSYWANLSYAYRIPMGQGKLSIGLQGTMRSYVVDFSKTESIVEADIALLEGSARKILPNFGIGIYYMSDLFYAGWSIPSVLNGDISLHEILSADTEYAVEEAHQYLMAGLRLRAGETVQVKPAMLIKQTNNAPLDLDLHASLVFNERLGMGATYRMGGIRNSIGESIDLLMYLQFDSGFRLGMAYDFTLSEVRQYNSGSFEIMLEQCIKGKNSRLTNPRFFF